MMLSLLSFSTVGIVFTSLAGAVVLAAILFMAIIPFKAWIVAIFSGAYIPSYKLNSLRVRKVDYMKIVNAYIQSKRSKLGFSFNELEAYHLSGGNCEMLISALYKAKSGKILFEKDLAKSLDLAGLDLMGILDSAINSKKIVIENISAMAQDGIEIIVCASAIVKANLKFALKGGDEETLKDKISAFIVEKIALSGKHQYLASNPKVLTKDWLQAGLDNANMYKLLNLEIVKLELGRDIGAEMAVKRAGKEKAFYEISAEKEKNAEVMRELQMKTQVEEMKAEVLAAEAEVPKAIADAIKEGRFSVMDYYKLMNLQADTALRRSILSDEKKKKG